MRRNKIQQIQKIIIDAQLIRELRRIDPDFDQFDFLDEVEQYYVPEYVFRRMVQASKLRRWVNPTF